MVLRFLERNFVWPGLDQIEASGEAEPLMRKLLHAVMSSPEMAGRTEREVYQRITALGSMCMSVCYSTMLEGKPDNIDSMKPMLYGIVRRALGTSPLQPRKGAFAPIRKKEKADLQKSPCNSAQRCGILLEVDTTYGRLAQLVEHLLDVQEVTGSSPVPSTIQFVLEPDSL